MGVTKNRGLGLQRSHQRSQRELRMEGSKIGFKGKCKRMGLRWDCHDENRKYYILI